MPKRAIVPGVKTPAERGPFGAWAAETRDRLDLAAETVAEAISYDDSTLRKVEGGSAPASRRMRRELPAYYRRIAAEKGVTIDPPPTEEPPASPTGDLTALLVKLDRQTDAINRLAAALEGMVRAPTDPSPEGDLVATVTDSARREVERLKRGQGAAPGPEAGGTPDGSRARPRASAAL